MPNPAAPATTGAAATTTIPAAIPPPTTAPTAAKPDVIAAAPAVPEAAPAATPETAAPTSLVLFSAIIYPFQKIGQHFLLNIATPKLKSNSVAVRLMLSFSIPYFPGFHFS
jgi:hypothetical protein